MGARAEKILMDFLEQVSTEVATLNQKKRVVRRNIIILDDRLMQNTIVLGYDPKSDFGDIYCKRGEVGVFYYGFYKSVVKKEYFENFIRIFNVFRTWNYKTNYVDLYDLFNRLTIMSFVEHWEMSLLNNPTDSDIRPLKLGDYKLQFICHDSSSVFVEIDRENNVLFTREYQREKNISSSLVMVKDKQEQNLILFPGSIEYKIMVKLINHLLDERRFFDKEDYDSFYEYGWEHTYHMLDFPNISSFQEISKKNANKVHLL